MKVGKNVPSRFVRILSLLAGLPLLGLLDAEGGYLDRPEIGGGYPSMSNLVLNSNKNKERTRVSNYLGESDVSTAWREMSLSFSP